MHIRGVFAGSHQAERIPVPGAQRRVRAQQPGGGRDEAAEERPGAGRAHAGGHDCRGGGGMGTCKRMTGRVWR